MKMDRMSRSEIIFKILSYLLITIFAIMCLYPIIYAFSVSISGKVAYETGQIRICPKDLTNSAYKIVFLDK